MSSTSTPSDALSKMERMSIHEPLSDGTFIPGHAVTQAREIEMKAKIDAEVKKDEDVKVGVKENKSPRENEAKTDSGARKSNGKVEENEDNSPMNDDKANNNTGLMESKEEIQVKKDEGVEEESEEDDSSWDEDEPHADFLQAIETATLARLAQELAEYEKKMEASEKSNQDSLNAPHEAAAKTDAQVCDKEAEFLIIKAIDQNFNEFHFRVKRMCRMEKLKQTFASRLGVSVTSLLFTFNGREISDEDTPVSLEMKENDLIDVHHKAAANTNVEADEDDYLFLKVIGQGLREVHFRLRNGMCRMKMLKTSYAESIGVPVTSLRFSFKEREISDEDTPESLEMKENDVVNVYRVDEDA